MGFDDDSNSYDAPPPDGEEASFDEEEADEDWVDYPIESDDDDPFFDVGPVPPLPPGRMIV